MLNLMKLNVMFNSSLLSSKGIVIRSQTEAGNDARLS